MENNAVTILRPAPKTVVQTTENYDQFTFMAANRNVSRKHIENIKKAFEEYGNITEVQPILVNQNKQVIDGQHRFVACQELGLPINYTVVHNLTIDDARNMNILHAGWSTTDFAHSYAATGNVNYDVYIALKEDYGFSHAITLLAIEGMQRGGLYRDFRSGNLKIDNIQEAKLRMDNLKEIQEAAKLAALPKPLAAAAITIMRAEGYKQKRMIDKLKHWNQPIKVYTGVEDNLRQLEEIYNYRMGTANRVRLYQTIGMGKIKIDAADRAFSEYIRTRDQWTCQRCHKRYDESVSRDRMALHCSHFQGRGKEATRFEPLNADALCYGCHQYFTSHPGEHLAWQTQRKGQATVDAIVLQSNTYKKKDRKAEAKIWRGALKDLY